MQEKEGDDVAKNCWRSLPAQTAVRTYLVPTITVLHITTSPETTAQIMKRYEARASFSTSEDSMMFYCA